MTTNFVIDCKQSFKGRRAYLVTREIKAQIGWPTTDQKVRGSIPASTPIRLLNEYSNPGS
jgi:hypothetical protein